MPSEAGRVFLSWSGTRSRAVAQALHDWLPDVIQGVKTWISSEDIEKGVRWGLELAQQLQSTNIGIICVTRENLTAPWLMYEVGALSKTVDQSYVCPYLLDVGPTDLSGPLAQFQATRAEEDDTKRLVLTILRAIGDNNVGEAHIVRQFNRVWQELQQKLERVPHSVQSPPPSRSDREILEEVLATTRAMERSLPPPSELESQLANTNAELRTAYVTSQVEIAHNRSVISELTRRLDEWCDRETKYRQKLLDLTTSELFPILEGRVKSLPSPTESEVSISYSQPRDASIGEGRGLHECNVMFRGNQLDLSIGIVPVNRDSLMPLVDKVLLWGKALVTYPGPRLELIQGRVREIDTLKVWLANYLLKMDAGTNPSWYRVQMHATDQADGLWDSTNPPAGLYTLFDPQRLVLARDWHALVYQHHLNSTGQLSNVTYEETQTSLDSMLEEIVFNLTR